MPRIFQPTSDHFRGAGHPPLGRSRSNDVGAEGPDVPVMVFHSGMLDLYDPHPELCFPSRRTRDLDKFGHFSRLKTLCGPLAFGSGRSGSRGGCSPSYTGVPSAYLERMGVCGGSGLGETFFRISVSSTALTSLSGLPTASVARTFSINSPVSRLRPPAPLARNSPAPIARVPISRSSRVFHRSTSSYCFPVRFASAHWRWTLFRASS
jgi:hypothetical protein